MTNIKIGGATGVVNSAVCATVTPVVHETQANYHRNIPPVEAHAHTLAVQAGRWLAYATERSRMTPRVVTDKALTSLAFSVHRGAQSFAVPSKLSGTRDHQRRLWAMVRELADPWSPLTLDDRGQGLVVLYDGDRIGEVQPKHEPWLRPLLPFGARLYLSRVTGHEREGFRLGCNVVVGHVGQALDGLLDALGTSLRPTDAPVGTRSGSGDGASPAASQTVVGVPAMLPAAAGDGVAGSTPALRLVVPPAQGHPVPDTADVMLWRSIDGTAHASVEHVVRHSPSGIEWGYGGSGPADLARSILLVLADEATAEQLYQRFKAEVIARVPFAGGVLRAADVHRWLDRQQMPSA